MQSIRTSELEWSELGTEPGNVWISGMTDHLGSTEGLQELKRNIRLTVGAKPLVRNLRALYDASGADYPAGLLGLKGNVYLITHGVGCRVLEPGLEKRIREIHYEASFKEHGSTVELFPTTRFRECFSAQASFETKLALDGHAAVQVPDFGLSMAGAGATGSVGTSARAEATLHLGFSVLSVKIEATGRSSSSVAWDISKDNKPLIGDQQLFQTVVVPEGIRKLSFDLRAWAVVSLGWLKGDVPLKTPRVQVEVSL